MNKENITKFFKGVRMNVSKRSPEILTGIGIAGMITTTVLAVKATPKALRLIEDKKMEVFNNLDPEDIPGNNVDYTDISLKTIEVIKVAWKPYIPAVVTGVASVTCLIGASSVNVKRNAALATAYELSKTALSDYKEKVVETIGEKKEQSIRNSIAKDKVEKNPVNNNQVIMTSGGDTLFLDGISRRYFKSDIETIKAAVNEVNRRMVYDNYISLSEFYDEIGLDRTDVSDELGWNLDDGLLEIHYDTTMSSDGRPCIVLSYHIAPKYDFSRLM